MPTYNEAKNIKLIIKQIYQALPHSHIIVVDDHSPDKTAQVVQALQKKHSTLHLISRTSKLGRGSAVLTGFDYAFNQLKADCYLEMDADLSHPAAQIPQLISQINTQNIVIASRYIKAGQFINIPAIRRLLSFFANQVIKFYLQTGVDDNSNGFRCYPKTAIKLMLHHQFQTTGYIVLSETLILLKKHQFRFKEVPTVFTNRRYGQSNTNWHELWHSWQGLAKIKHNHYIN